MDLYGHFALQFHCYTSTCEFLNWTYILPFLVYSLIVLKHPDKWMKSPIDYYKDYVWNMLLFLHIV